MTTPVTQPAPLLRSLPKTQQEWELLLQQLNSWQQILLQAIQVATPQAGWGTPTSGSLIANFPGSGATTAQCGAALSILIAQLQTVGILAK